MKMSESRWQHVHRQVMALDALPDGAFFARMAEMGIDIDELAVYAEEPRTKAATAEREKAGK